MNYNIICYVIYIPITIILTVWVASILSKSGRVFLQDVFHGNTELIKSVNKLLLLGFYLVNISIIILTMTDRSNIDNILELIHEVSMNLGLIMLVVGLIYSFNLFVLFRFRKGEKNELNQATSK